MIGVRTKIWQFASVIRNAQVGADCTIASGATIDGAKIGDRCIVSHNVLVPPGVLLQDDVFVGPNVVFCNDRRPAAHKKGFDPAVFRGRWTVLVGNSVSVGSHAVVLPGVTIGHYAMVAAGAVVEKNVPENMLLKRDGTLAAIDDEWRQWRTLLVC